MVALFAVLPCIIILLCFGQKEGSDTQSKINQDKPDERRRDNHTKVLDGIAARYGLTNREKDILGLLDDRYTTNDIAEILVLSVYTVKTHMKNVYAKLGGHSQKGLISLVESFQKNEGPH